MQKKFFHESVGADSSVALRQRLTKEEQHKLFVEWNATHRPYPDTVALHQLIETQVEKTPEQTALIFEGQVRTYRELNSEANQLAHQLQKTGVKPNTLVGVCMERSLEMIVSLLAVLKAGGAYIPLDPAYPLERLAYMIQDAEVRVLLTQSRLRERLPKDGVTIITADPGWNAEMAGQEDNPTSTMQPDHLAYMIYTSGSTGKPKGVMISHRAVVNFVTSMCRDPGITADDLILAVTSISFDIAVLELLLPLTIGARVHIASQRVIADGRALARLLETSGATIMQTTPSLWRMLITAGWAGNRRLKILCGGEALPMELAAQLRQRGGSLWNMYGPTETTIWSAIADLSQAEERISIGRAIGNTQLYVLDATGSAVPIGIEGELYIGGVGVANGYWRRPDLTAERFLPNPFSQQEGARMYRTGDLVRWQENGTLEYLGRIDHQVKIRGFRIELGEIETVLKQLPEIHDALVVAREDAQGDKRLIAYVVLDEMAWQEEQEMQLEPLYQYSNNPLQAKFLRKPVPRLRRNLSKRLPEYMIPSHFVLLDVLPLTPNGKIDRQRLPVPQEDLDEKCSIQQEPRTPIQDLLVGLWCELLGYKHMGIDENFFELGGHSLLGAQVIAKVAQALAVDLPLRTLLDAPTVRLLSTEIENLIVAKIAAMSEDEVQQLLATE